MLVEDQDVVKLGFCPCKYPKHRINVEDHLSHDDAGMKSDRNEKQRSMTNMLFDKTVLSSFLIFLVPASLKELK